MTVSVLLAIDDRPDNLFVLEQLVRAYLPEIKLITAESAEAGLALAATEAVDGALIDVQMPGMSGIEMCRRLKADPRTAPIHVILVTAHGATSELKAQGLEAGADDFITKPIDNVELAAKLGVMLRLRAAENALRTERDHLEEKVRKRTQALRDTENRYRTLFQAAADPIFISDQEGRLLEVNEGACRLLGYTQEELLHLTVYDIVTPEYAARRSELLKQLRATDHLLFETELVARDGRIIPAETSSRLMDLNGRPTVLSIARDISERQAAAAALRDSEELYRSLFENMLNGFAYCKMLFDQGQPQDFIYLSVNRAFETQTGLQNVVGKKISEVIPGIRESNPELLEIYGRVALTGKPERVEIYLEALEMWFSISAYSPEKEYFVAVFDVITERKQAEEALKESLARTTEVQDGTIQAMAAVTETRDPYTAGHQRRVTQLACAVAQELGLPADRVAGLRVMGLLHDLGKISIPAEILSKPGKLSEMEFNIIKSHSQSGYEIVKEIRFPWPVAEVILQHHERLDGSGYPQGLQGDEIVLEAKILAVADVVEAMSSHRPYRPELGIDKALDEIAQKKGVLYDPEVVDACIKVCTEDKFTFE